MRRFKTEKIVILGLMLVFYIFILSKCESEQVLISHPDFSGKYELSWSNLPKLHDGSDFKLGGFSSLKYMGDREFVVTTTRGPVINSIVGETGERVNFLSPEFVPEIVNIKLTSNNKIKINDRHPIKSLRNEDVSGLPASNFFNVAEIVNPNLEPQVWGMNPAGITYSPDGNFYWIADKYGPTLFQLTGRWGELGEQKGFGNIVRRMDPYFGLRKYYLKREGDGGFSGIDLDSKGRLVAILEKELFNRPQFIDSLGVTHEVDTLDLYRDRRRVVRVDPNSNDLNRAEKSAIYEVESSAFDGVDPENVSISGFTVVDDTTCILSEFGETGGNVRNLLVKVILPDSIWTSPTAEGIFGKSLETLTPFELDSAGLSFAVKREIIDISDKFDKPVVGIALVDNNKIAVLEKQNFGIVNGNVENGTYDIIKEDIHIEIIEFNTK